MNTKVRKLLLFSVMPVMAIMLMSSSGGGKKTKSGDKIDTTPGCEIIEVETQVTLFQMYNAYSTRLTNYPIPVMPSLWTGGESATSLFDNSGRYFCLITVSADCDGYSKSYTWNPTDSNGITMNIPVPEFTTFQINVEYYEQCGPYWGSSNSPRYERGRWVSQSTQNYSSNISVTQWVATEPLTGC
ncbi:hypothetical protein H7F37_13370 [Winogradskyella sp. PAMC22761]|nr:hypothetical protein H7F37_13370 [Winogradskyella sp. PAMC22761]